MNPTTEKEIILKQLNQQPLPSKEVLDTLLRYEDGELYWRTLTKEQAMSVGLTRARTEKSAVRAGHVFQTSRSGKSIQVRVLGKSYYLHRIIWKMIYNEDPDVIDHIDGNPLNNRIDNLRNCSVRQNSLNQKLFKNNTSGITGVSWSKCMKKWEAYIWNNCKKISLGHFTNKEEAVKVRKQSEIELNYHQNHGTER